MILRIYPTKKIIEENGDYLHCNPIKYNENYMHSIKKMTASKIWEYDKIKVELARIKVWCINCL